MERIWVDQIAKATGGKIIWGSPENYADSVSIDSRTIKPGGLFIAIKGERVDGHDYLKDVAKAGAGVIILEKDQAISALNGENYLPAVIKVSNTETALQDLAAWYISLFSVLKVGITGSTGKTTTKEMLFLIMSEKFKTVCNQGNFNNLIGLPLSVFQVDNTTEAAVFEMGMDRPGEIHRLAEIIRPNVGVITNIGVSHLERLGSRENILKAKAEICNFLGQEDTLVINSDNDLLSTYKGTHSCNIFRVGSKDGQDLKIDDIKDMGEMGTEFTLENEGRREGFHIESPGTHNVSNGALAMGAAMCLGISMKEGRAGLGKYRAADKRLHIIKGHGIKIIDDTYNASPDSMKAAINVTTSIKGKRKIAILGDMFELGEEEKAYHFDLGEYASQKKIDVVLSVGKNAEQISLGAGGKGTTAFHFENKEMLKSVLPQWLKKGDVILVKGSRGMKMDEIVKQLEEIKTE